MARKFETDYRIGKNDEVLRKANATALDIDLRLDAIEKALVSLGSGADTLVARVLRVIEQEIAPRAAEIEALLTDYRAGVPAASVEEEADGRQFLTPARRAAILGELRDGVDASGDTLAKLLALILALDAAKAPAANAHLTGVPTAPTAPLGTNTTQIATMAALLAMRNDLVNGAGSALDQINELAAALNNDANFGAVVIAELANRLRLDTDGGYSSTQMRQGQKNVGLMRGAQGMNADFAITVASHELAYSLGGSHTATLDAPAALGIGFRCSLFNDGAQIWTVAMASGTIDGKSSIKLYPGERCSIHCDGNYVRTIGRSPGSILIQQQTASNVASVDFSSILTADFETFEIEFTGVRTSSGVGTFCLRVTEDGNTWKAGSSDYAYGNPYWMSAYADGVGSASAIYGKGSHIILCGGLTAVETNGRLIVRRPSASDRRKQFVGQLLHDNDAQIIDVDIFGTYNSVNAITGVRFFFPEGRTFSGTFSVRGLRKQ